MMQTQRGIEMPDAALLPLSFDDDEEQDKTIDPPDNSGGGTAPVKTKKNAEKDSKKTDRPKSAEK